MLYHTVMQYITKIEFKVMALIRDYCCFLKILERINHNAVTAGK